MKMTTKLAGALTVVATLALAPSAGATPATLDTLTQTNGVLSASWTLANDGSQSWDLEVATSPARYVDGFFIDYLVSGSVAPGDTSFTAPAGLPPGTYYVYIITTPTLTLCEADDPACVLEFSNVLSVNIPAPPPPPPPPPPPLLAPLSSFDPVVAEGDVTVASSQDVDKLGITLSPGENLTATLSGTVSVPGASKVFKFKTVTQSVAARTGPGTRLALKLSGKAKKAVKQALKRKKILKAKLKLLLMDAAGNKKTRKYKVRLKP
jgi:hypothetical protein